MLILVLNQWESACLLSSDFRSENPLTQTRTFHIQTRCKTFKTNIENTIYHTDSNYKFCFRTKKSLY